MERIDELRQLMVKTFGKEKAKEIIEPLERADEMIKGCTCQQRAFNNKMGYSNQHPQAMRGVEI